ncbi:putative peptidoglycan-binding domain-containing protein [Cryptosporangium arvum DSM 44712]|uniref:Putative peptidoglycan-binding domain-containing protein n=2 Tax=Cryptosporangium TaxID=65502 RepID=A0A010Z4Q9_9ACTN|nr:putative peptidoglycan-binding domain-containing protein [Cryptosporangium arvum DSM 44712]
MKTNRVRNALSAALVTAGIAAGLGLTAEPALAASCTGTADRPNTNGKTRALIPAIGRDTNCTLGNGNQSSAVRALQDSLNRCHGAGLTVDGIYGARTATAVRNVQRGANIAQDGVYGPQTRNAMLWAHYYYSGGAFLTCGTYQ